MRCLRGLASALLLAGAWLTAGNAVADDAIEFNRDVRGILSDKCFFCHGPDANKREADLRLDQRDAAVAAGAIQPGRPDASEVMRRVMSQDPDERMPPPTSKLGQLTAQEIDTLERWIGSGAAYQPHWSFIPLKQVALPPSSVAEHPIDQLVKASLAKRGLALQVEADRPTLIRRLSFDLNGLPPTADEIAAFVDDEAPDAYEKLVDRLLARESYGERMAVDWLDVARYADSYGFQVDRERDMWPWRDWVVRALNDNLPYDQFITWQIAGDLLPQASDDQILATAFNRLHQQESEGGSVEEEYRVEYVADRVQTFATAFLGLTFECARCHDHKFDPITQRDYYGLFAMFQNIDEAGLYSYFTQSPPTPTLWLADADQRSRLAELAEKVDQIELEGARLRETCGAALDAWAAAQARLSDSERLAGLSERLAAECLGHFSFDELASGKQLANSLDVAKPAKLAGQNELVPGQSGQAVQFTGDDPVNLEFGNFARQQPFSVSLWLNSPDRKERAVVFHRSRAWTDAASRGYELLIEDGKLKWSLIHFWPGNAISIATRDPLTVDQWQHVTVTYDGSSRAAGLHIYVNGRLAEVDVVKDALTKEITGGGGDNIALGERFRDRGFKGGKIDEFRVWARELTPLDALAIVDPHAAAAALAASREQLQDSQAEFLVDTYLNAADKGWREHLKKLEEARAAVYAAADSVKEIMVMRELATPKKAYILTRGEYSQRGQEVVASVPEWLLPLPEGAPSNRLGLANWLTDKRHPLTARVAVNRIWQALFGRGLVKTSEDFGSQGSRPQYPEVLDWLALHFLDSGWNTKELVKTIVMSQTYRQRSWADASTMADDPDNDWLARGARFRLPAEMIRDNALAAAGLLKPQVGGPPVHPYELSEAFKPAKPSAGDGVYRRSLYTNWRRTGPPPAMVAFDAPRRAVCVAKRERTDSPLQALILLNGVQYVEAARVLGEVLHRESGGDVAEMVRRGSVRCLSRLPDAQESEILAELYAEQLEHFSRHPEQADELLQVGSAPRDASVPAPAAAAATVLAQALLNHDFCVVRR